MMTVESLNPFLMALVISMVVQMVFFGFAATFKTDKVTDLSYGLTFIIIAWFFVAYAEKPTTYEYILAVLVTIWGLRLASYLLFRILKTKTDKRFDHMRDKPLKFAQFWLLQGVSVAVIMVPVVYLLSSAPTLDSSIWPIVGGAVWLTGLVLETAADWQLYNFRFNKKPTGKWIDEGLWHYSRHPNYFGEMLVWWGIFVFGLPVYSGYSWLVVVGPLFITALLMFVSGVPILEKNADRRWGKDKDYQNFKKTTSVLIPLPKKRL